MVTQEFRCPHTHLLRTQPDEEGSWSAWGPGEHRAKVPSCGLWAIGTLQLL